MEYAYSLIYTVLYVVLWNLFVRIFTLYRNRNTIIFYSLQILLVLVQYGISFLLMDDIVIKQILVILVNAILAYELCELKKKGALLLSILYQGCDIAIEYLSFVFLQQCFGFTAEELLQSEMLSYIMGLLCQMIMLGLILMIRKRFAAKTENLMTEAEWLRFSVFPIFSILSILAMMTNFEYVQSTRQGLLLLCIVSGLVVMNILVFGLLNDALKRENHLAEYRIMEERSKKDLEMYEASLQSSMQQKKLIHEFKNHMTCMAGLLKQQEYEKLNRYLEQIHNDVEKGTDRIDTNHKIVNAVLNGKYREAQEKDILLVIKTNDLSKLWLKDQDIVILLSNLLNNALEAAQVCTDKTVWLDMAAEEKQFALSVTNSCRMKPPRNGDTYVTTKTVQPHMHGIGIENIKSVVTKYHGNYAIKEEDSLFSFSILIPYH